MRAIDPVTLIKKVGVKVNSKPWCFSEIISAIQKRQNIFKIQNIRLINR